MDHARNEILITRNNLVAQVMEGLTTSKAIPYVRPHELLEHLQKDYNGGQRIDWEIDTNGWQWDFWITFELKGKNYMISGDGFANNHITFSLNEEE